MWWSRRTRCSTVPARLRSTARRSSRRASRAGRTTSTSPVLACARERTTPCVERRASRAVRSRAVGGTRCRRDELLRPRREEVPRPGGAAWVRHRPSLRAGLAAGRPRVVGRPLLALRRARRGRHVGRSLHDAPRHAALPRHRAVVRAGAGKVAVDEGAWRTQGSNRGAAKHAMVWAAHWRVARALDTAGQADLTSFTNMVTAWTGRLTLHKARRFLRKHVTLPRRRRAIRSRPGGYELTSAPRVPGGGRRPGSAARHTWRVLLPSTWFYSETVHAWTLPILPMLDARVVRVGRGRKDGRTGGGWTDARWRTAAPHGGTTAHTCNRSGDRHASSRPRTTPTSLPTLCLDTTWFFRRPSRCRLWFFRWRSCCSFWSWCHSASCSSRRSCASWQRGCAGCLGRKGVQGAPRAYQEPGLGTRRDARVARDDAGPPSGRGQEHGPVREPTAPGPRGDHRDQQGRGRRCATRLQRERGRSRYAAPVHRRRPQRCHPARTTTPADRARRWPVLWPPKLKAAA